MGKKDGTFRLCQYYEESNRLLVDDKGGIGDIQSIFNSIGLASGFFQLEIVEEDKHKRLVETQVGSWGNRIDRALASNACHSQLPIVWVLLTLKYLEGQEVKNWLDDVLITSDTLDEHADELEPESCMSF